MLADTQGLKRTRSQPKLLTGNSGAEGDPRLGSRLQKFQVTVSVGLEGVGNVPGQQQGSGAEVRTQQAGREHAGRQSRDRQEAGRQQMGWQEEVGTQHVGRHTGRQRRDTEEEGLQQDEGAEQG